MDSETARSLIRNGPPVGSSGLDARKPQGSDENHQDPEYSAVLAETQNCGRGAGRVELRAASGWCAR
jgi:hypothetical protein